VLRHRSQPVIATSRHSCAPPTHASIHQVRAAAPRTLPCRSHRVQNAP
jgi:hypothetical protein